MRRSIFPCELAIPLFVGGLVIRTCAAIMVPALPSDHSSDCELAPADDPDPGGGDRPSIDATYALDAAADGAPLARSIRSSRDLLLGPRDACAPRLASRGPPRCRSV